MVHQHFMLVPTLTVAENMMLGREPTTGGQLDRERVVREVSELSKRTGLAVHPERKVADLSVGEAQRVEILKTLYRGAKILILDEPTAVLSPPEIDELWQVLRGMRERGETIVLITHKLDEVMEISDTITVMRQGRTIEQLTHDARRRRPKSPKRWSGATSSSRWTTREASSRRVERFESAPPARRARSRRGRYATGERGERHQLRHRAGRDPRHRRRGGQRTNGAARCAGRPSRGALGCDQRRRPRHHRAFGESARRRRTLAHSRGPTRARPRARLHHRRESHSRSATPLHAGVRLDNDAIVDNARRQIEAFDIRPAVPSVAARALSGGNQQKVVIAREMSRAFQVLLAAQPTRGVDVGAIEFIHARLREARDAGKAILLVSADLAEILALSDRIAVMYGGQLVAVLPRRDASEEVLGPYMTGAGARRVRRNAIEGSGAARRSSHCSSRRSSATC